MDIKLDILVITAHPDDAELGCGGTIVKHISKGYKVGIIDLTRGELGTRGTVETRKDEAENAKNILGVSIRENLGLEDGFFENNKTNKLKIIEKIRQYRPDTVITNAIEDRHIDHPRAAQLVTDACFLSGLQKIETGTERWRPKKLLYCIQDRYIKPDFIIDVSDFWAKKIEAVLAFKTQFYSSDESGPKTPISGKDFLDFLEARARELGRNIGVDYAEGFVSKTIIGIEEINSIF